MGKEEYARLLTGWNPDQAFIATVGVSVQGFVDAVLPRVARNAILARGGKLVARFSPLGDPELEAMGLEHYFGFDARRRLWELGAPGPLIEVWALG